MGPLDFGDLMTCGGQEKGPGDCSAGSKYGVLSVGLPVGGVGTPAASI